MKLRIISPIHVGDGEEIIPWEYSVTGSSFSYYSVEKITEGLRGSFSGQRLRNMLIKLRDEVRNSEFRKSLGDFLRENNISIEPVYTIPLKTELKKGAEYKSVKSFIKNTEGAYVPGSEIKGALRTVFMFGVIYRDMKEGGNLLKKVREILINSLNRSRKVDRREKRSVWEEANQEVQKLIFFRNAPKQDAKYDIFKAVLVSDTEAVKPSESLYVDSVKVLGSSRDIEDPHELMKEGVELSFSLKIDEDRKKGLNEVYKNPYIDLLTEDFLYESSKLFYKFLLDREREFFGDRYYEPVEDSLSEGDFLLRIGKHQGFLNITIMLPVLLGDRKLFDAVFKEVVPQPRDKTNKTRKVTSEGKPLGWVVIS
ncbi:MAG: type III-A CRISPR-associated RAMP protein Csm5 [Hydrogenobacter thermophilus]|uniref:type III-A CRISPR-associated RAMP protein Csm5 n=1 Tax=Hydrogenobacter thermophilus TaxID=940 RepID=UPI001C7940EA|nr:type III-A CRISPR-associated RAMP protein Csm5 [Hydrogenobacter thermophilus]QWK20609.1 MAG: type III-A CRISPR-associated RAMP protein Csm5 [Hydrogenobacter thermophilus]